jgi:hypothetical protein
VGRFRSVLPFSFLTKNCDLDFAPFPVLVGGASWLKI